MESLLEEMLENLKRMVTMLGDGITIDLKLCLSIGEEYVVAYLLDILLIDGI